MIEETLSTDALYEIARALADRGEDYGYSVYYDGPRIPAAKAKVMIEDDATASAWIDAFRWATKAYRNAAGEDWVY